MNQIALIRIDSESGCDIVPLVQETAAFFSNVQKAMIRLTHNNEWLFGI